jgi:hypothetical protein
MNAAPARTLALSLALSLSLGACASRATHAEHATRPLGSVEARLAPLPSPTPSWTTPLASLTAADVASLCRFEQRAVSPRAVREHCPNGRTVTVGANGGFCDGDALSDALVIGAHCPMTVGDLVACELALRDDPCAIGRAALPECEAFDACVARLSDAAPIASAAP